MGQIQVHPMSVGRTNFGPLQMYSAPYPLGCLVAYAKAYGEGRLNERFNFRPITPVDYEKALPLVDALEEPGIFLFSSYVWNHAANVKVAEHVKRRFPDALVIFGGPQVPRERTALAAFFAANAYADLVVRGEGEEALAEVLDAIQRSGVSAEGARLTDFSGVAGLTYRHSGLVETPDRERPKSIEAFPSPYTTGLFDHWVDGTDYMALETNRGCPYGCTFCDWGASTLAKIRGMSLERVFGEIEYCGRHKISAVFIVDANFGILKRDVEIAAHMVQVRERCGFPRVVSYSNAKVVRPELKSIIRMFRDAGLNAMGQIAVQTTDETVLNIVKRSNIKTSEYDKLVAFFRKENIPALSDIMVGLPGATLESCKKDLQFLFDRRIHARIFQTIVMPNAPMADPAYRARNRIQIDPDGMVESTFSFTKEDFSRMAELCYAYKLLGNFGTGIFKYVLLFMQLELGVRALDYVTAWLALVPKSAERFPISSRLFEEVLARPATDARTKDIFMLCWDEATGDAVFGNVPGLLREAFELGASAFGIRATGPDVDSVVRAQSAVLPSKKSTAGSFELPHDVAGYFANVATLVNLEDRSPSLKPLCDYGAGIVEVREGRQMLSYNDFVAPFFRLELPSNLAC